METSYFHSMRLLLVLLVVISIAPLTAFVPYNGHTHEVADPIEQTVYITKTGERYHRGSCGTLRKSKIAKTLSEAKALGYTPCGLCKPPR